MFAKTLIAFTAVATLVVPTLAVPKAAWVRRQADAQTSLTLDPAVISPGLAQDGQGDNPDPGQVRSLTSTNNFINFCLPFLDQGIPVTNGQQIATGSCNPTPIGRIISLDKAPRCKFVFPKNGDESLVENQAFTVQLKLRNMQTGFFVNAQANYYGAPQQVNDQGFVKGHSHVVIELLPSIDTTEPLDPNQFKFFKGLNDVAQNDILSAAVTAGLPAGAYRICSINTGANHQPTLVSNAQHGTLDDCVYFTVKKAGENNNVNTATKSESATVTNADKSASETATVTNADKNASESVTDTSVTETATATEEDDGKSDTETATETAAPDATEVPEKDGEDSSTETATETAPDTATETATETADESTETPPAESPAPNQDNEQQPQQNNEQDNQQQGDQQQNNEQDNQQQGNQQQDNQQQDNQQQGDQQQDNQQQGDQQGNQQQDNQQQDNQQQGNQQQDSQPEQQQDSQPEQQQEQPPADSQEQPPQEQGSGNPDSAPPADEGN